MPASIKQRGYALCPKLGEEVANHTHPKSRHCEQPGQQHETVSLQPAHASLDEGVIVSVQDANIRDIRALRVLTHNSDATRCAFSIHLLDTTDVNPARPEFADASVPECIPADYPEDRHLMPKTPQGKRHASRGTGVNDLSPRAPRLFAPVR
jgi:hypothetical protein